MRNLVIILPEKLPDTKHTCFKGGCPFFKKTQSDKKSVCDILWGTNPKHIANSLASLCNYYDTCDITLAEIDSEQLNAILNNCENAINRN